MTMQLPSYARYGLTAAAVVAAVVVGANFFGGGQPPGGQVASPTPAATPVPTSAPPWDLRDAAPTGDLPAGDYYLDIPAFPARIDVEVPAGWWHYWPSGPNSDVHAILVNSSESGAANGSAWGLGFTVISEVRKDPCKPTAGNLDPSASESVDSLVAAMETWSDFSVDVEDASIGGFSGKRVEVAPREPMDCTGSYFRTPHAFEFGVETQADEDHDNPEQFTLLDVDGSVLVIWTTDYPARNKFEIDGGASPDPQAHVEDQATLHEILDSIVITPH